MRSEIQDLRAIVQVPGKNLFVMGNGHVKEERSLELVDVMSVVYLVMSVIIIELVHKLLVKQAVMEDIMFINHVEMI